MDSSIVVHEPPNHAFTLMPHVSMHKKIVENEKTSKLLKAVEILMRNEKTSKESGNLMN